MSLEPLHMSFSVGQTMKITAMPASDCPNYSINIGHDSKNFALHFNPRFNCGETVCNARTAGIWGEEMQVHHQPFKCNTDNKFAIEFTKPSFLIKLPDGQQIDFPNRFGEDKYNHLEVAGDAKIISIEIK